MLLLLLTAGVARGQGGVVHERGADRYTNSTSYSTNFIAFTGSGKVHTLLVQNSSSADAWLHIFDSATNKLNGTAAEFTPILVPTTARTGGFDLGLYSIPVKRGFVAAMSTTDRALTNATTDFKFTVIYSR